MIKQERLRKYRKLLIHQFFLDEEDELYEFVWVPSISVPYSRDRSRYSEDRDDALTEAQMKALELYTIQIVTTTDKTITVG